MTPRQEAFVREYLIDLNATQAAIRAGYSEKTAGQQGEQLLKNLEIADAVQAAMANRAHRLEISADRVLQELARLAFFDPATLGEAGINGPEDIGKLPEHVRKAIVGWSWDKAGNFTLKLADKISALEKLGRHLKLFTERHEHTGPNGGPIEINQVQADADDFTRRVAGLAARAPAGS